MLAVPVVVVVAVVAAWLVVEVLPKVEDIEGKLLVNNEDRVLVFGLLACPLSLSFGLSERSLSERSSPPRSRRVRLG